MLKIRIIIIAAAFLIASQLRAQHVPGIVLEDWASHPAIHNIPVEYVNEPAVVVSDLRRVEYIDHNDEQVQYRTLHRIVRVNDDRGIETFNRIYLPVVENNSIVDIRARTILPGGKVIELDKKDIKEIKEDNNIYKIFAMEGLVKGSEIEYLYTYAADLSYFGREVIQGNHAIIKSKVEIIAPERLVFDARLFNGTCTLHDTITNGKMAKSLTLRNIPGADEEKYSMHTANLQRVEYKLSYNKAKNDSERILTWNELAKSLYNIYEQHSEKELKKLNGIVEKNGWKKLMGDKEKVVAVENYFKKNIAARSDINSDEGSDIEWILKNKMASHRGMVRLFSAALNLLGVAHEQVICGSRENYVVDKTFENWLSCNNSLIYISSLKKFVAPTENEMRFPWIEPLWAGAEGLFCKPTTIGNFTTAIAYLKPIGLESAESNQSNIEADLRFNATLDTLQIDARNLHSGYVSSIYRRMFNYNSDEEQQQVIKSMIKHNMGTERILSTNIENKEFEKMTDNLPFVFSASVQSPGMIEKAGGRILVKVGEIIGPQVEMYQAKKRLFPIELAYPHIMSRKIRMQIPEGYRIKNIDDLRMKQVYKDGTEVTMGFESDVTMEGNRLTVNIVEQYRRTYYPVEQYDPFRKVINAAADFNKVVLVLEKI